MEKAETVLDEKKAVAAVQDGGRYNRLRCALGIPLA